MEDLPIALGTLVQGVSVAVLGLPERGAVWPANTVKRSVTLQTACKLHYPSF